MAYVVSLRGAVHTFYQAQPHKVPHRQIASSEFTNQPLALPVTFSLESIRLPTTVFWISPGQYSVGQRHRNPFQHHM